MTPNCALVNAGYIHRKKGSRTEAVCSAEKESVEATEMAMAQTIAGHQERSHAGIIDFAGTRARISSSCGGGGGLRQGSLEDIQWFLPCSSLIDGPGTMGG